MSLARNCLEQQRRRQLCCQWLLAAAACSLLMQTGLDVEEKCCLCSLLLHSGTVGTRLPVGASMPGSAGRPHGSAQQLRVGSWRAGSSLVPAGPPVWGGSLTLAQGLLPGGAGQVQLGRFVLPIEQLPSEEAARPKPCCFVPSLSAVTFKVGGALAGTVAPLQEERAQAAAGIKLLGIRLEHEARGFPRAANCDLQSGASASIKPIPGEAFG